MATVENILDGARTRLNDFDVAGGTFANDTFLLGGGQGPFPQAYRRMFDAMGSVGSNRIQREFYLSLAAYTTLVSPTAVGLSDMAEPDVIQERPAPAAIAITSTSTASPINVLATAHGLSTNQDVIISGVSGTQGPLGRWFITKVDANNFTLNGSVTDGNAGTGGIATSSSAKFTRVNALDYLPDRDLSDRLGDYIWEDNVLKFRGSTAAVQLWLTYSASGNAPTATSTVLNIDNCENFLIVATAHLTAKSKGWKQLAGDLAIEAYGPKGEAQADGSGGLLRDFLNVQVKKMQRTQRYRKTFRSRQDWARNPILP